MRRLPLTPYAARMSIAFKEWTFVCDALACGTQSIIIRKGGTGEGRFGFRFMHAEFLLFPTHFHEQVAKLKLPPGTKLPEMRMDSMCEVTLRARVEWTQDVTDLDVLRRLAPFHIWQDSEIEKRFRYEEEKGNTGVSVAFIRVEKMSAPFVFPDYPQFGGCRSWIDLPEPPGSVTFSPVLDDATHRGREAAIRAVLA